MRSSAGRPAPSRSSRCPRWWSSRARRRPFHVFEPRYRAMIEGRPRGRPAHGGGHAARPGRRLAESRAPLFPVAGAGFIEADERLRRRALQHPAARRGPGAARRGDPGDRAPVPGVPGRGAGRRLPSRRPARPGRRRSPPWSAACSSWRGAARPTAGRATWPRRWRACGFRGGSPTRWRRRWSPTPASRIAILEELDVGRRIGRVVRRGGGAPARDVRARRVAGGERLRAPRASAAHSRAARPMPW